MAAAGVDAASRPRRTPVLNNRQPTWASSTASALARRGFRAAGVLALVVAVASVFRAEVQQGSSDAFVAGRPARHNGVGLEPRGQLVARSKALTDGAMDLAAAEEAAAAGWQMMPLGVPKVAYRIPGAPNAEWVDIYNRLYRERIIFLGKEIDDKLANEIIGVLLYLDSEDQKPIYLYINSAGGSVIAGLAIYDTMQHIKSPVITINVGVAASMASFLLAAGEKGKRLALPHSRVMIHQAMGGAQGQAEDIKVEAQQILTIHENLIGMYSRMTGKSTDVIREDIQRDHFFSAEEAKEYGIIDSVIKLQDMGDLPSRAPVSSSSSSEASSAASSTAGDEEPKTDSAM
eukprot:TRINITY_DN83956_c0_g1_i1.p1 TRINITY_DN83956_c0_g1~~TRINITY_DN83956_c0_g1_i1.p1  ORF type:complete len:346 (-),score=92.82 TRINITY_DN83956_c0_g1_i1:137-1174(-)